MLGKPEHLRLEGAGAGAPSHRLAPCSITSARVYRSRAALGFKEWNIDTRSAGCWSAICQQISLSWFLLAVHYILVRD